jgi:cytochrome b561
VVPRVVKSVPRVVPRVVDLELGMEQISHLAIFFLAWCVPSSGV